MIKLARQGHTTIAPTVGGTDILVDQFFPESPASSTTTEAPLLAHNVASGNANAESTTKNGIRTLPPGESFAF